ncbi:hypothetical protein HOLleu_25530 [Holothuria leucospilota]|uniref:BEN domain-containing protein n=1 Tax=Holothuria leucospilota TaxID=206669 RepID=A0A9Q1BSY9_HOLLE|nr:hypothetical protein HOLleu_25530 [Holothuria leucospilota]
MLYTTSLILHFSDLSKKRSHKTVGGSSSNKDLPRKKVCPPKAPSTLVQSSSKPGLSAQAVVPVALVRKEPPTKAKLPAKGGAIRVRQEGTLLSPHSPTPPPVFLSPVTTQQPQGSLNLPQTMPAAQPIQPAPSLLVYQTTPSVTSAPSQQGLNYMETPHSTNLLNYDLPTTHSQAMVNQVAYFSTLGALTEKVNVIEQTMVKLTEVLTKINGKPLKTSKVTTPIYVDNMDGSVQVGDENDKITLNKKEVDGAFSLSLTGKDFVLKMMSIAFTAEELAASNYSGGRTICGSEIKHKMALIDHWKFKAILASAECNFPGCTDGHMLKVLKDAVNNKCRKVDGKMKHM